MYRVAVLAVFALGLSACSLNTKSLSFGYNDDTPSTASISPPKRPPSVALGGEPSAPRETSKSSAKQVAKLNDKAPSGTFEKAPRGALADRDYSATNLEIERARSLINAYRAEKGLKPLTLNALLTSAAKAHSRDLAKWDRISHFGSDGSNPWDRVKRAGYNARVAAENVGTGQVTFEEVLRGWKESAGHNKNLLLTDADHMGIALVHDPKTEFKTFWTLVVGSSM